MHPVDFKLLKAKIINDWNSSISKHEGRKVLARRLCRALIKEIQRRSDEPAEVVAKDLDINVVTVNKYTPSKCRRSKRLPDPPELDLQVVDLGEGRSSLTLSCSLRKLSAAKQRQIKEKVAKVLTRYN